MMWFPTTTGAAQWSGRIRARDLLVGGTATVTASAAGGTTDPAIAVDETVELKDSAVVSSTNGAYTLSSNGATEYTIDVTDTGAYNGTGYVAPGANLTAETRVTPTVLTSSRSVHAANPSSAHCERVTRDRCQPLLGLGRTKRVGLQRKSGWYQLAGQAPGRRSWQVGWTIETGRQLAWVRRHRLPGGRVVAPARGSRQQHSEPSAVEQSEGH